MKAIVICPDVRSTVEFLSHREPLVLTPILGKSLLDRALSNLAETGAQEVLLLVTDRADAVRAHVQDGTKWGIQVEVEAVDESCEPSTTEVWATYGPVTGPEWLPNGRAITVLDRLPDMPDHPLFETYNAWFHALCHCIGQISDTRVGEREIKPGVWAGLHSHISPKANLQGPVWIGDNVWIGADAQIGPETILETGAYVDRGAEVVQSVIAPRTYVGALTEVKSSVAIGNSILNWHTGVSSDISDDFLLSDLVETPHSSSVRSLNPSNTLFGGIRRAFSGGVH